MYRVRRLAGDIELFRCFRMGTTYCFSALQCDYNASCCPRKHPDLPRLSCGWLAWLMEHVDSNALLPEAVVERRSNLVSVSVNPCKCICGKNVMIFAVISRYSTTPQYGRVANQILTMAGSEPLPHMVVPATSGILSPSVSI
jgi:hypothetical protein